MQRRISVLLGLFTILVPLSAGQLFWKVDSGDSRVYLLGSMHAATEDFYPLPQVMTDAFAESDYLVVEADIREEAQREYAGKMVLMAMYPDGDIINNHISAATLTKVDERLKLHGMNLAAMSRMKPWMIGLTLISLEMQKAGYDMTLGIDLHFLQQARADSLPIVELEGMMYQMDLFNNFNDDLQEQFLLDVIDNQTEQLQKLETMATAWKEGDEDKLEELILEESADPDLADLYEVLIYARNQTMTESILEYLDSGETWFVIVGAGHLVGERGVVQKLRDLGYTVQRP